MSQKQAIGVAIGVVIVTLVCFLLYKMYGTPQGPGGFMQSSVPTGHNDQVSQEETPSDLESISETIVSEGSLDLSALEAEEEGEALEIEADSESVNNLSTSYDENSLQ